MYLLAGTRNFTENSQEHPDTFLTLKGGNMNDKEKVIEEGKTLAWLSYLGILFLVPLLVKADNEFCKFHVKQGIVIFIGWVIVNILWAIPFIGWFTATVCYVILLIVSVAGIIKSVQGEYWKAPLGIGELAEKFKF